MCVNCHYRTSSGSWYMSTVTRGQVVYPNAFSLSLEVNRRRIKDPGASLDVKL